MNRFYALFIGLSALAGLCFAFFPEGKITAFVWLLLLIYLKDWKSVGCIVLFAMYGMYTIQTASLQEGFVSGRFSIQELKHHQSPFYQDFAYRGTIEVNGKCAPCTFYRKKGEKVAANTDYFVVGELQKRSRFDFVLKPKTLTPIENSTSLAEFRYTIKNRLKSFLKQKLHSKESSNLLFALIGGEVEERSLRYKFSKVGLQHILAISGFHFGLLISFLSSMLGVFLTRSARWFFILAAMSLYFIFIGSAPAIERAWLSSSLFFLAKWLKREIKPLNLLGLTLFIELCIHPYAIDNLGFQLSYLSCFGILAFFNPLENLLASIFPKRRFAEIVQYPIFDQLFFLTSSFFRSGLAISFAVNITILPLLLAHFGAFPPLSLIYNLFYPPLIGALLFVFLITTVLHLLIPAVSTPAFYFLDHFARCLVHLVSHPPPLFDAPLQINFIPSWFIPLHLLALFFLFSWTYKMRFDRYGIIL
jgi:competence protein ComEC